MSKTHSIFRTLFYLSILAVAVAIVSLLLFKIIDFTGTTAATIVGLTAMLGGLLMIASNIGRYCTTPRSKDPNRNRFFILIEWIICGAVISFAGFIILYGGFLK